MHHLLGAYAGVMPTIALIIFVTVSVLVTVYVITDRRRAHHRRMEAMALDEAKPVVKPDQRGGAHV